MHKMTFSLFVLTFCPEVWNKVGCAKEFSWERSGIPSQQRSRHLPCLVDDGCCTGAAAASRCLVCC
jgi:hypothetical protein